MTKEKVEWETPYQKKVRISESDLEWLKNNREEMSMAAFLHYIIQSYRAKKNIYE